jgi:Spy/CpxP family protein refolding chaperone
MKKLSINIIAIAMLAIIATVGWAYNSYAYGNQQGPRHEMLHKHGMFKALGVTDDQKARLKEILQKYRPALQTLMKQYYAEKHAMRRLVHAGSVDESAIGAQAAKVSTVEANLAVQRAHLIHDMRAVLTQEQLQKLSELEKDRIEAKIDRHLFRLAAREKGE